MKKWGVTRMVLKLDKENLFVKIDNENHYH